MIKIKIKSKKRGVNRAIGFMRINDTEAGMTAGILEPTDETRREVTTALTPALGC
jgi:hypothetical protein